jgi:hypothetical protein
MYQATALASARWPREVKRTDCIAFMAATLKPADCRKSEVTVAEKVGNHLQKERKNAGVKGGPSRVYPHHHLLDI